MEAVMEMAVKAVMVAMVMEAAGGGGAGRKRDETQRGGGNESQRELLQHFHLLSLYDAIRRGGVRDDLEGVVSDVRSQRLPKLFRPPGMECDPAHAAVFDVERHRLPHD